MVKLSPDQAKTLFEIVKFANQHGGRIPTGPEFAKIISIGARGALSRIRRIMGQVNPKDSKNRYIDYDQLVTEKESAQLCLKIHKVTQTSHQGRVTKPEIIEMLGYGQQDCDVLTQKLCDAGYIHQIAPTIQGFRATQKIFNQLEYLQKLADQ